jgi:glyoxylase-like metal-dependent hydrolase (beta-lactamase superfamily II)
MQGSASLRAGVLKSHICATSQTRASRRFRGSDAMSPAVASFLETTTSSVVHVAIDLATRRCVVVDAVLGCDVETRATNTHMIDRILQFVAAHRLDVVWILETHVHADHLSGAWHLKAQLGAPVGIGAGVIALRSRLPSCRDRGGGRYDGYFVDGERLSIGDATLRVMATPGHTPTCVTYLFDGVALVGDTLFMPDYGTARADFPGGDARTLYRSIRRLLALPGSTRLFCGHDYLTPLRATHRFSATVAEQRRRNVHVHDGIGECEFVALRKTRDGTLTAPALMGAAVPFNLGRG